MKKINSTGYKPTYHCTYSHEYEECGKKYTHKCREYSLHQDFILEHEKHHVDPITSFNGYIIYHFDSANQFSITVHMYSDQYRGDYIGPGIYILKIELDVYSDCGNEIMHVYDTQSLLSKLDQDKKKIEIDIQKLNDFIATVKPA
jgi:hypothetical protein